MSLGKIPGQLIRSYLELRRHANLGPRRIRELQSARLQALVTHAYENVPFYRGVFDDAGVRPDDIRTPDDLQKLPVIRRNDFQAASWSDRMSAGCDETECVERHTGGSTGEPLSLLTRRRDLGFEAGGWLRTWLRLGLRLKDLQVAVKDPEDAIYSGDVRWFQRLGILRVKYLDLYDDPGSHIRELERLQPTVLRGSPSILMAIAREMSNVIGDPDIRPRLLFTTSERLDPGVRNLIEKVFRAPVHDCYGATEAGCIAWRCPRCASYHVNSDYVILEVLNREGTVPDRGNGEIVVTNLFAKAMPIIRYSLGDMCQVDRSGTCGEAREPLSIRNLLGRTVDQILLADGSVISPYNFMPDAVQGVLEYQIIQEDYDRIRILVVRGENFRESSLADARAEYERDLGDRCKVVFEFVDDIPTTDGHRFKKVISKVAVPPGSFL